MKHKFEIKASTVEGFNSFTPTASLKDLAHDPSVTTTEFNIDSECLITVIGDNSLEHSLIVPASALVAQTQVWLPVFNPCRRIDQIPEEVEMPRVLVSVRQLTGLSPVTERQEVSEISIEDYDLFGSPSSFIKKLNFTTIEENTVGEKDYLNSKVEELESALHSLQITQTEREKDMKLENQRIRSTLEQQKLNHVQALSDAEMVYKNQLHTEMLRSEKYSLELIEKTQYIQTQTKQIELYEVTLSNETKRREALEEVLLETRCNYQTYLASTKAREIEITECIAEKDQIIHTLREETGNSKQNARDATAARDQTKDELEKLKMELEFYKLKLEQPGEERLIESENRRIELHNALKELTSRMLNKPSIPSFHDSNQENAKLKQQIQDLNNLLKQQEAKYTTLLTEFKLLKEHSTNSSSPLNQSLLDQISDLNTHLQDLTSENQFIKASLNELQDQNSKYREVVSGLKSTLNKQSVENTELTSKLNDVLSQLPHDEKPMDTIDQLLKDYMRVNNIKNPFVRLAEGVYTYGTKRLSVTVRNGMPVIRVGGGYMFIEEFLKIYIGKNMKRKQDEPDTQQSSPLTTPRSRSNSQGPDLLQLHKRCNTVTVMVPPFEQKDQEIQKQGTLESRKLLYEIQNTENKRDLNKSREVLKKSNLNAPKKPSVSPKRTKVSQKQTIKPLRLTKGNLSQR